MNRLKMVLSAKMAKNDFQLLSLIATTILELEKNFIK